MEVAHQPVVPATRRARSLQTAFAERVPLTSLTARIRKLQADREPDALTAAVEELRVELHVI